MSNNEDTHEENPQAPSISEENEHESSGAGSEDKVDGQEKEPGPFLKLLKLRGNNPSNSDIEDVVSKAFLDTASNHPSFSNYNVVILFDHLRLHRMDANNIYQSLSDGKDDDKPILLILDSSGGDIAAAYLIGKLCRETSSDKFIAAVPRQAKSAATLICCGADEIHMGSLSELGPIDPQFEGVPALALKYSIEHLAELSKRYPDATNMFSNYLSQSLDIEQLGYYERVAESATQYAERLLRNRRIQTDEDDVVDIASRLVYQYKDHGFVIDSNESEEIFGSQVIQLDTPEYNIANDLFNKYRFMFNIVNRFFGRHLYITGKIESGCNVFTPNSSQSAV